MAVDSVAVAAVGDRLLLHDPAHESVVAREFPSDEGEGPDDPGSLVVLAPPGGGGGGASGGTGRGDLGGDGTAIPDQAGGVLVLDVSLVCRWWG